MKKLMFAAVVFVALASQAASFTWTANGVLDLTGTARYTDTATLFAITNEGDTFVVDSAMMVDGSIYKTVTDDEILPGTRFYYELFDDRGMNCHRFTSDTKTLTQTHGGSLNFGSRGKWVYVFVPEPTSGLLMLLGVAGLALKRKCA